MRGRWRERRKVGPPIFEAVLALSVLLALAVFGIPQTVTAALAGAAAVLAFSIAVALGVARWRGRGQTPARAGEAQTAASSGLEQGAWSADVLQRLEWRRFEELCVAYFEALGFRAQTARLGANGGIDVKLYRGESQTPAVIVRCKAWNADMVGVTPVRELRGAMAAQEVDQGFFVASGAFTREAREFAAQEKINLLGGDGLLEMIKALAPEQSAALLRLATQGDFSTPTCPACGVKMVSRKSRKRGKAFWGCVNYPRCRYTFMP